MDYTLTQRTIPLDDSYEVIVVGGGPTGCTAAISAAREGATTLLLEYSQALGGSGTSALVPAWCPFSDKEKIIYRGLAQKVLEASKKATRHVPAEQIDWVPIDPESLKVIYDEMVTEAGVTVLFGTFLSAVDTDDEGNVSAIIVSNKGGMQAYRAKVYVDCTGDADLAAWAGAEFQKGDGNGEMQPATHCFVLSNVDEYAYRTMPSLHGNNPESPIYKILDSGKYPLIPDHHLCNNTIGPGTVGFNAGHVFHVDNTDPASVSKAVMQGRKIARQYRDALAEFVPDAFGNAFLVTTGSQIGIRETRRIIGDYILVLDDYLDRRTFEDEICRNSYFIDLHLTAEEARQKGMIDVTARYQRYGRGESHGIPYRCLTPKDLKNVLVAGRSISCEHTVHGSIRVMPVCLAMGEAAGMAATHALRNHKNNVHAVNTEYLRQRLREEGAYLP